MSSEAEVAVHDLKRSSVLHSFNFGDNVSAHDWEMLDNILSHMILKLINSSFLMLFAILTSTMYRHQSVGRLSSRSLSKIKNKVEIAFGKAINNENQSKNALEALPTKTNSIKSLVKCKYQSGEKFTPFSTALKNGLLQTDRKQLAPTPVQPPKNKLTDRKEETTTRQLQLKQRPQTIITCKNLIKDQVIRGYAWFHKQNKPLSSVCKKNNTSRLRYFAISQPQNKQTHKLILAAIQDDLLYAGSKQIMAIKSNAQKLINKTESLKVSLQDTDFVLVVDQSIMNFTNLNRMISDIYDLIGDGVHSLDALVKIIGRKLMEGCSKNLKNSQAELFILLILVQNRLEKLRGAHK